MAMFLVLNNIPAIENIAAIERNSGRWGMVNYGNNLPSTLTCPVTSTEVHLPPGSEKGGQDFRVSDIIIQTKTRKSGRMD